MPGRIVDPTYVPLGVTTPPGTTPAAPLTTVAAIGAGILRNVEIQIPRGHAGLTGVRLELAGQPIVPFASGSPWITADDYDRVFDVDIEVDQGLKVVTYNQGAYPHAHYLRFALGRIVNTPAPARLRLVSNDVLNG